MSVTLRIICLLGFVAAGIGVAISIATRPAPTADAADSGQNVFDGSRASPHDAAVASISDAAPAVQALPEPEPARPSPREFPASVGPATVTPVAYQGREVWDPLREQIGHMEAALRENRELLATTLGHFRQDPSRAANEPVAPNPPLPEPARPVVTRGEGDDQLVVNVQESDLRQVLELLGKQGNLNILASRNVAGTVSATLNNVDVFTALDAILKSTGHVARHDGRFIYVGTPQDFLEMDQNQDRVATRVYRPNYINANELKQLITPLLSTAAGQASVSASQIIGNTPALQGIPADTTITGGDDFAGGDILLVRDFEAILVQIDQIVAEVDRKPRQVAIEAMILSVKLDDENELGVNFELLLNRTHARLISGSPLGNLNAVDVSSGGLKFGFLDSHVSVFVDALETIGDTNVVAAPRLMCLNKQRAEILIGSQLGYVSTTVTENAATQAIEFLEVGTQLRIRPYIASDHLIRMEVHPELSTGSVRVEQGFTLPDKDVTQVTTNVMCPDGRTVIIGGLIREDLGKTASQIPWLGSLPLVGAAFRQQTETTNRHEIIVLLTPRIVEEPMMSMEGHAAASAFMENHQVYADKMSFLGKRHYGRRYLRLSQSAWSAGDPRTAFRYANLAVHFDPMSVAAASLRAEIVAAYPEFDQNVHQRLVDGLSPWKHPHENYSREGYPWRPPHPNEQGQPVSVYEPGEPGEVKTIRRP